VGSITVEAVSRLLLLLRDLPYYVIFLILVLIILVRFLVVYLVFLEAFLHEVVLVWDVLALLILVVF